MKFAIGIRRTTVETTLIEVEAETEEQAQAIARAKADNVDEKYWFHYDTTVEIND